MVVPTRRSWEPWWTVCKSIQDWLHRMRRRAKHWQHGHFHFFSSEFASLGHSHNWQQGHFHFFLNCICHFKINFVTLTLWSFISGYIVETLPTGEHSNATFCRTRLKHRRVSKGILKYGLLTTPQQQQEHSNYISRSYAHHIGTWTMDNGHQGLGEKDKKCRIWRTISTFGKQLVLCNICISFIHKGVIWI